MTGRVRDDHGDEQALVEGLRAGKDDAFRELVRRHQRAMVRVAEGYVPSRSVAEEVVQETWLAVIEGVDRFEGRSSIKTWIFRILVNRARNRGTREHRTVPFASLDQGETGPVVDPDRFLADGHRWAGNWAAPPEPWSDLPGKKVVERETRALVDETVRRLPPQQRQVITLRDIEGWPSEEVCALLELSEGNQRVLLHRARGRVRAALERHFAESGGQT